MSDEKTTARPNGPPAKLTGAGAIAPTNRVVRLALVQFACSADPDANVDQAAAAVEAAADQGAKVVLLPELFRSLYFAQTEDHAHFALAEPLDGPTTRRLQEIAKRREVVVTVPLFERRAAGVYHNSAVVVDADGSIVGAYRKMHIPDDPGFYEKFYFTPGDLGFRVFKTRYLDLGVLICWDQWFPEGARLTALQGADLLYYPT
ncbi:MAG: nitrilase-related carbon-nitrogen hydrolase, partial [Planctomycetia bacterium]